MWHEYSPRNPHRPVYWRWERAGLAASNELPLSRRRDDKWVARIERFRRDFDRCRTKRDLWLLSEKTPDLFFAHQLWENRDDEDRRLLTHEVEARILAGCEDIEVAARCELEPDAVSAYEAAFFDVRQRLHKESYILHQVFGRSIHTGVRERMYDLFWKLYAYRGGPEVLNVLVRTMIDAPRPDSSDQVVSFLGDQTRGNMVRKANIASYTLDASNGFTQTEIIAQYLKMIEIEDKGDAGKGGQQTLLANIQVMLDCIPFAVGNRLVSGRPSEVPELDVYDNGGVELRGDELISLSAGRQVVGALALQHIAFPELPGKVQQVLTEEAQS